MKIARYFLYLYVLCLPLLFYIDNARAPFELIKHDLTVFAMSLAAAGSLLAALKARDFTVKFHPLLLCFAAFALSSSLSYFLSIDAHQSFWGHEANPAESLISILSFTLFSFYIINACGDEASSATLLKSLLIGAVPVLLLGVWQRAGGDLSIFASVNAKKGDVFSTIGLTVAFAVFAGALSPLIFRLAVFTQQKIWFVFFFLTQAAIALTGARTPTYLNLLLISVWGLYLVSQAATRKRAATALTVAAAAFALNFIFPQQSELLQKSGAGLVEKGASVRLQVWQAGLARVPERPLFGFGPETFSLVEKLKEKPEINKYEYWQNFWSKAHNNLVQTLVGQGLVGFGLQLLIFVYGFVLLVRSFRQKNTLAASMLLASSYIFLTGLTGFNLVPTQMLSYLLPTLAVISLERDRLKIFKINGHPAIKLTMPVLAAIFLAAAYHAVTHWYADVSYQQAIIADRELGQQNFERSLAHIERAIELDSDNGTYRCYKGASVARQVALKKSSLPPAAQAELITAVSNEFQRCLELAPLRVELWTIKGDTYHALYKIGLVPDAGEAEAAFQKITELAPSSPLAYFRLARLYRDLSGREGQFENAITKVIELKVDFAPAYVELIKYAFARQKADEAKQWGDKLAQLSLSTPDMIESLKRAAAVFEANGDRESDEKLMAAYERLLKSKQ